MEPRWLKAQRLVPSQGSTAKSTPGPVPVPTGLVEEIRCNEDDRGLILTGRNVPFAKGTEVQIISGAFADHIGRFESATDDERVVILVDLMGRQVRAKVQLDSISAHV